MNVNGSGRHTNKQYSPNELLRVIPQWRLLKVLVRKASNRREQARKALEDHETTHMTATATASGAA